MTSFSNFWRHLVEKKVESLIFEFSLRNIEAISMYCSLEMIVPLNSIVFMTSHLDFTKALRNLNYRLNDFRQFVRTLYHLAINICSNQRADCPLNLRGFSSEVLNLHFRLNIIPFSGNPRFPLFWSPRIQKAPWSQSYKRNFVLKRSNYLKFLDGALTQY